MVILTEQLVETKSKVSDIRYAIRLNAWGSDLHDISILLRMPRLEVLALSVNKIRSLSSLQKCHRLKEVYLRRNEIQSFEELKHLRNAQGLRSLWMEENPCSEAAGANYRACVLRMLPQVTKLDDVEVCESELKAALQNVPYPAPKSTIRAPVPQSVSNPKGIAARASREAFERERQRGAPISLGGLDGARGRPQAPARLYPMAPFRENSEEDEDEIILPIPSPRERIRFGTASAHPDNVRELSQRVIPAENPSGNWLSTEFEDSRPLSLPAVQSVPSFSVPRYRTGTRAAGPGAFFVAQSRQGAHELFGRRQSLAPRAEFSRSTPDETDYDMLESGTSEAIHGSPGIAYSGMRRLRTNSNLLSSALCLIREMDTSSLEDLSHAISEIVQERSQIS
ncbi:uncharacterized protein LOC108164819 [Drosophila miranda]|uniref:uncharacterized protein LOC108164819 n=1 Tax=Drosophila miranda TaxID=7229 RepID=UPI0007E6F256|nr:uncharacterized protein LOC108164819 [Drosophila miranda]